MYMEGKMTDTTTAAAPIAAIKGFNRDLTCRGFQFEVGKTYSHNGQVKACASGFHACTDPRDVFGYYAPGTSRFCEVILSGAVSTDGDDSKVAAEVIEIVRELTVSDVVARCVAYAAGHTAEEDPSAIGDRGAASATGLCGAASTISSTMPTSIIPGEGRPSSANPARPCASTG